LNNNWYVLRVKSRAESKVASQLNRDAFTTFYPRIKTPRPNSGPVLMPLFPGYLFLQIDINSADAMLTHDRSGVLGWLRFGDTSPFLTNEIVNKIKQRENEINNAGGQWRNFRPGEMVHVISGNLVSLGEVLKEPDSSNQHIRVLLDFMGRKVSARVPWHALSPINPELQKVQPRKLPRRTRGRGRWIRGMSPRPQLA
jgi:transcriptional antiterminator RfaH